MAIKGMDMSYTILICVYSGILLMTFILRPMGWENMELCDHLGDFIAFAT